MKNKKRKVSGKLRLIGSASFVKKLVANGSVRVEVQDWINYWFTVEKGYRKELEAKKLRIAELERRLSNLDTDVKQQAGNFSAAQRDLEKATEKIVHLKRFLVVMLVPWADMLGSRKIRHFIADLMGAINFEIPFKVGTEVLAKLSMEMGELVSKETYVGKNTPTKDLPPLGKVLDVFTGWVNDTFKLPPES